MKPRKKHIRPGEIFYDSLQRTFIYLGDVPGISTVRCTHINDNNEATRTFSISGELYWHPFKCRWEME